MQDHRFLSASLLAMTALAGCTTMTDNSRLNEARNEYVTAQNNPQIASLAPGELTQAGEALAQANAAARQRADSEEVTHLAYLAKQRVAIAQETARQKAAEMTVSNAGIERNNIRLQARTSEAEKALQDAQSSEQMANEAQREAQALQQNAEMSQQQAEESQRKLDASELQAAALLQDAAIARQEAELSQQQAREAEVHANELEAQLKELNAKKTDRGLVITLNEVLFDPNGAELKPGSTRRLQKLADFLKKYPDRQAEIEGHTDNTGNPEHNRDLSERRANAVREVLVSMGVSPDRITTQGYGPESPIASNATPAGRQMNRRVEVILSGEEPERDVSSR